MAAHTHPTARDEVEPVVDSDRLMRVRAYGGFWSKSAYDAMFYADGTLVVDVGPLYRERRASATLSAAELEHVNQDIGALALCQADSEACRREDATDHGLVIFDTFGDSNSSLHVSHYQGSKATPREFLDYEELVLRLIYRTAKGESE